ncbi:MAG: nicotinamide mononucleotide transporter [Gammaproteobacteria bacterium]|nr:nicotinamide mononucleotide transporter [Gammaproteobacteria bacterium]
MISIFDLFGAVCSFTSTIFYMRINVLAWPIGLLSSSINIFLCLNKALYGDAGLHGIYLILTLYGWYQWKFGGQNHAELPISTISRQLFSKLMVIALIAIFSLVLVLKHYTNSQIPVWDATTTVLSLIAQWLMCRKIIETWVLWFFIDAMYGGIYIFKGLPFHGGLQLIYVGMAVIGFWHWKMQQNEAAYPQSS